MSAALTDPLRLAAMHDIGGCLVAGILGNYRANLDEYEALLGGPWNEEIAVALQECKGRLYLYDRLLVEAGRCAAAKDNT